MVFFLQGLRKIAGRPKRKYSQGWEKSNLATNEEAARQGSSMCIKMHHLYEG